MLALRSRHAVSLWFSFRTGTDEELGACLRFAGGLPYRCGSRLELAPTRSWVGPCGALSAGGSHGGFSLWDRGFDVKDLEIAFANRAIVVVPLF